MLKRLISATKAWNAVDIFTDQSVFACTSVAALELYCFFSPPEATVIPSGGDLRAAILQLVTGVQLTVSIRKDH